MIQRFLMILQASVLAWSWGNGLPECRASVSEKLPLLLAKRERIRMWAPLCADGSQSHGVCPFGDMTIFSGMSCLAGETARCEDVRRAQGPDGRWWRSPELVGEDREQDSFSRDQSEGALAYLVATRDVNAALRWQNYLEGHRLRMCPDASDNRCKIMPGTSRLFGAVWSYLGLSPAHWMNRGEWYLNLYEPIEAEFQRHDFPMHLSATQAWIRREIERRGGPAAPASAAKVVRVLTRREPENPYFLLLRDGPTEKIADLILAKCPDERPSAPLLDWSWQRGQKDRPWLHASGHDCIFLINLFEREIRRR